MNALEEVKDFIGKDFRFFENVRFIEKEGEDPFLIFENKAGEALQRHPLEHLNRVQIAKLMKENGFKKLKNPGKKPKLEGWDHLFDAQGEYIYKDAPGDEPQEDEKDGAPPGTPPKDKEEL